MKKKGYSFLICALLVVCSFSFILSACRDEPIENAGDQLPDIENVPEGMIIEDRTLVSYSGLAEDLAIPAGVTTISAWAFWECTTLKTVTIPSTVSSVGYEAFRGCASLKTINCKLNSAPSGWSLRWKNGCSAVVVWEGKS